MFGVGVLSLPITPSACSKRERDIVMIAAFGKLSRFECIIGHSITDLTFAGR